MVIIVMKSDKKILHAFRWAVEHIGKGQKEVGDILDIKQPAVSLLLSDKREVKQRHINALAKDMGITPVELMERAGEWADVTNTTPSDTSPVKRRSTDTGNMVELSEHQIMVTRFKDPERGKEINETLLKIEELDPDALDEINSTLKIKLDFLRGRHSSPQRPPKAGSSTS